MLRPKNVEIQNVMIVKTRKKLINCPLNVYVFDFSGTKGPILTICHKESFENGNSNEG
jgi:hypothetical protein